MMDYLDRKILDIIQSRFPITREPFRELADDFGVSESEVISRIKWLKNERIIRRVGAVFDSKKLGYASTLVAMRVPEGKLEEVAKAINEFPGVTHNYARDHAYNLWFTLTAPSPPELEAQIDKIKRKTGISHVLILPAVRLFKIGVEFNLGTRHQEPGILRQAQDKPGTRNQGPEARGQRPEIGEASYVFTESDKKLIRMLQEDVPIAPRLFKSVADKLGLTEEDVISKVEEWKSKRVIRRFGAILSHRRVGFKENAMVVWCVPPKRAEEVGEVMATFPEVSHCYERPTYPDWPYNLFTMVHGRTKEDCQKVAEAISKATGIGNYMLLFSTKEFKKTSMKYFVEG
ncbi:MAG: AsnC family transcriptional regulator [Actinomycetota bacterium]|nr:AsnC family transcriptional regulator [Actinomycetota bacterium]